MTWDIWSVCTCLMAALFVVAIATFCYDLAHSGMKRACTRATLISLLAGWIGLLPVNLADSLSAIEGVIRNFYDMVDLATFSVKIGDVEKTLVECLGPTYMLASIHVLIVTLLSIFVPLVVISSVVSGLRELVQRYKIALLGWRYKQAYVLSGASHAEAVLARDILANAPGRPFVVFCNVAVGEKGNTVIEEIRSGNRGNVVFTVSGLRDTVERMRGFADIHCFAFSENTSDNVELASSLVEWARRLPEQNVDWAGIREREGLTRGQARRYAKRCHKLARVKWHVYCLHDSTADELIFDSLLQGKPHLNVEVRLISEFEERIMGLFTRHPLYEVLEPADPQHPQDLLVLAIGLGSAGVEAMRTAYWLGRMGAAVRLHIVGVDVRAGEMLDLLQAQSPEMMLDTDPVTGAPTVRLIEADATTDQLMHVLDELPLDWRTYCIVALGDDARNLECAVELRRMFLKRAVESIGETTLQPLIAPVIYSNEEFRAAQRMTSERGDSFALTPFGKMEEAFSYRGIVASAWEQRALNMNAAYDECWVDPNDSERIAHAGLRGSTRRMARSPILEEYAQSEIKKLSNRMSVRHAPYKLWYLGLESAFEEGEFIASRLSSEQWLAALGITPEQADALFDDIADVGGPAESEKALQERLRSIRAELPTVFALSDMEHDRWCAYYRAHGWEGLTVEEAQRLHKLGIIKKASEHQSALLKRHCYLCDSETLLQRGAQLGEDPFRYDRAAVIELRRIMTGEILA